MCAKEYNKLLSSHSPDIGESSAVELLHLIIPSCSKIHFDYPLDGKKEGRKDALSSVPFKQAPDYIVQRWPLVILACYCLVIQHQFPLYLPWQAHRAAGVQEDSALCSAASVATAWPKQQERGNS